MGKEFWVLEKTVLVLVFKRGIIEFLKAIKMQIWQIRVNIFLALLAHYFKALVVNNGGDIKPKVKGGFALDFYPEITPDALLKLF